MISKYSLSTEFNGIVASAIIQFDKSILQEVKIHLLYVDFLSVKK